ncbi:F-BAR and double SH3 domains protein 2 [Larimichthys crocea]|uniref:Uncharacterized protein n=1 Tax=Larimichthys crocea TaxID=215358 RepID=A0ACD3RDS1_LARCR|nr:F-BAR and double SH3 domains protein 2 [Larimichthys crocea]
MDGDVYEDLRSHFTLLCGTEMDTCLTIHKQYSRIWESVAKVSALREVCAAEAEGCLVKEAKKWATKAAKDYKIITHGERALQTLESRLKLLSGETGLSVEQKIAEVQDSVRKAKEDEFELTDFEDYDDENGDIFADPVSASGVCVYPAACRVIYSYQASQSDELSIMEGEELQVIEDGDMEDWLKVCNSCGQVGYVPERYVQFLCLPVEDTTQLDSSFSSTSSIGNKERATSRARALYSYQAQSAEELSFQEGALIHLIRCRHGEVDDGFWEGELNGHIGVFPSLVVEILHDEGEEEEEDEEEPLPTPTMPCFSPPITSPSNPGCSSALSATPPSGVEDKQQGFPQRVGDVTIETGSSSHNSPDLSSSPRPRPCRAPPPPPTQKPSPQP